MLLTKYIRKASRNIFMAGPLSPGAVNAHAQVPLTHRYLNNRKPRGTNSSGLGDMAANSQTKPFGSRTRFTFLYHVKEQYGTWTQDLYCYNIHCRYVVIALGPLSAQDTPLAFVITDYTTLNLSSLPNDIHVLHSILQPLIEKVAYVAFPVVLNSTFLCSAHFRWSHDLA